MWVKLLVLMFKSRLLQLEMAKPFLKQAIKGLQIAFDHLCMDDILLDNQKAIALSHTVNKSLLFCKPPLESPTTLTGAVEKHC